MNLKRTLAVAVTVVLGGAGLLVATSAPAFAGDIGDPYATGCANHVSSTTTATVRDSAGDVLGHVYNHYSQYCNSNWGVVNTGGLTAQLSIVACQQDGGGCSQPDPFYGTSYEAWSDMVVGTHVVCVTGTIFFRRGGASYYGSATTCQ
jgi:hypothetical protein